MNYLSTTFDKYGILSYEEEVSLFAAYRDNNDLEAARKIVLHHLRLVEKVVKRYLGYGLPKEDLFQEGVTGLMIAVKKFDPSKGVRIAAYALLWIKQCVTSYVEKNLKIVKTVTTRAKRKLFWNKSVVNTHNKEEVEKILGVSTDDLDDLGIIELPIHVSFDDDSMSPEDWLVSKEPTPEEAAISEEEQPDLSKLLERLDQRRRYIIRSRYLENPVKTLQELSDELGISVERVRQLEADGIERMRNLNNTDVRFLHS